MKEPYDLVMKPNYFREVLRNMGSTTGGGKARFGNQGGGHAPNYQVTLNGSVRRYSGQSHSYFHDSPQSPFDEDHLSPGEFSYFEVAALLTACINAAPSG